VNVFYRDIEQVTGILLQFWFWLTPIVYVHSALPPFFASALALNPMTPIVQFAHAVFLEDHVPSWVTLAYPAVVSALLMVAGTMIFRKLSGEIVDEL